MSDVLHDLSSVVDAGAPVKKMSHTKRLQRRVSILADDNARLNAEVEALDQDLEVDASDAVPFKGLTRSQRRTRQVARMKEALIAKDAEIEELKNDLALADSLLAKQRQTIALQREKIEEYKLKVSKIITGGA